MCGGIDVMLSEEGGYYTVIEVNELALSGSSRPFHFPNHTRVYVLLLPAFYVNKHEFFGGLKN